VGVEVIACVVETGGVLNEDDVPIVVSIGVVVRVLLAVTEWLEIDVVVEGNVVGGVVVRLGVVVKSVVDSWLVVSLTVDVGSEDVSCALVVKIGVVA
jgi:hypothetical protein